MNTRSADAALKGFYYQFDATILQLLNLSNDSAEVTIEGIEDIDVDDASKTTAIQCKYLSRSNFTKSILRDPIILMLEHFIDPNTRSDLNYVLYVHLKEDKTEKEIEIGLDKLKGILTYKKEGIQKYFPEDKGVSDVQLETFLSQFRIDIAKDFEVQQKEVLAKIKDNFNCDDFEADNHYYNNALRVVFKKATQPNIGDRRVSKKAFINKIDCKEKLFSKWFIKLRSKKQYLSYFKDKLKSTKALMYSKSKFIFIGKNIICKENKELPLEAFSKNMIEHFFKPDKSLRNAKPPILVLECKNSALNNLKKYLIKNRLSFNDGFENIRFSPYFFNSLPIINTKNKGTKISKASFLIKVISSETFYNYFNDLDSPDVFLIF